MLILQGLVMLIGGFACLFSVAFLWCAMKIKLPQHRSFRYLIGVSIFLLAIAGLGLFFIGFRIFFKVFGYLNISILIILAIALLVASLFVYRTLSYLYHHIDVF